MDTVKEIIKKLIPDWILTQKGNLKQKRDEKRSIKEWLVNGMPVPPPHRIKQLTIQFYQKKHNIRILIETGTYLGDMIIAQLDNFNQIFSIELDFVLWRNAVKRLKYYKKVKILQGDSSLILKDIMSEVKEKAIFWLDGHYSGGNTARSEKDCPIIEELDSILISNYNHILSLVGT